MQKNLTLKPNGGYAKIYKRNGKLQNNAIHFFLSELFSSLGVGYKENCSVKGIVADFVVNGKAIFCRRLSEQELGRLKSSRVSFIFVGIPEIAGSKEERAVVQDGEGRGKVTLFIDDPSFNFDYAHILPATKKCSVMHGHTSSVLVEITGRTVDGMVLDFGDAKEIIRNVIREIDHKLFINKRYIVSESTKKVNLKFNTIHGSFSIEAPKKTTVLMDGEATTENLASYLVERIAREMPENVTSVGVYVYEGMNKGAYILANIHSPEV